jgi:probable HAF family extracellular repeat protein
MMMLRRTLFGTRTGVVSTLPTPVALLLVGFLGAASSGCGEGGTLPTGSGPDPGTAPPPEATHSATVLPGLGGTRSNGWVINEAGLAAGWSNVSGGRAIRWSEAGVATDLLGADSGTRGINNAGAVVGWVRHPDGIQRGFVHVGEVRIDLENLDPGVIGVASAINDAGTVVGVGPSEDGPSAVVWRQASDGSYGAPLALGFGSPTQGPSINSRGDVAFSAYVWNLHRAVIWPVGPDGDYGDPIWLGRPVDGEYYAQDINDRGVVVGFRKQPWGGDSPVAVVWFPGDYDAPVDLGIGEAWSVNENNQIVGTTGGDLPVFGGAPRRAALWTIEADGSITGPEDLGTPSGYQYGAARHINEAGAIIGSSWGPGEVTATVWKPKN